MEVNRGSQTMVTMFFFHSELRNSTTRQVTSAIEARKWAEELRWLDDRSSIRESCLTHTRVGWHTTHIYYTQTASHTRYKAFQRGATTANTGTHTNTRALQHTCTAHTGG